MWLSSSDFLNGIVYSVYTYDPLTEHYIGATEHLNEWRNSGLAKPLDNVSGDFDFGNMSFLISRDEPVIPAPKGANVYAADSGVVVKATDYGGRLGYVVAVMHGYDDISAGVTCVYYHLGDLTVKEGDTVERGDLIGHVSGSSFSGVSGLGYGIESWVAGGHHMIASDDPEAVNVLIPKWWD